MSLPNVADWIARITAEVAGLEALGNSQDLAHALATGDVKSPSVYVVLSGDSPGPSELTGGISQLVGMDVAVVVLVHNLVDTGEIGGDVLLREVRGKLFDALLNWAPPGCDPVEAGAGQRISGIDANLLIWQQDFTCQYLLRAA